MPSTLSRGCCNPWVIQALRFGRPLPMALVWWLSTEEKTTAHSVQVWTACFPAVPRLVSSSVWIAVCPPDAIPLLVGVIHAADARSKENVNATENCISAVGKVMRFQSECVNLNLVLPHWLSWLPLNEDKEEAVHTFDFLCDLIER